MFECFMLNARYVITVQCHFAELWPCHLELCSAITGVDTLRTIPVCYHPVTWPQTLFYQGLTQFSVCLWLVSEPSSCWRSRRLAGSGDVRWSELASVFWTLIAQSQPSLCPDWPILSWLEAEAGPGLSWGWDGEAEGRRGEAAHHRSGCSECRVNIATHWHKPSFDMTSPMTNDRIVIPYSDISRYEPQQCSKTKYLLTFWNL